MADETPTTSNPQRGGRFSKLMFPWYYATRAIGASILLFGVFGDETPERGTIILTGAGLLGLDKVARSEPPAGPGGGGANTP